MRTYNFIIKNGLNIDTSKTLFQVKRQIEEQTDCKYYMILNHGNIYYLEEEFAEPIYKKAWHTPESMSDCDFKECVEVIEHKFIYKVIFFTPDGSIDFAWIEDDLLNDVIALSDIIVK